jgi:hypothetical protein
MWLVERIQSASHPSRGPVTVCASPRLVIAIGSDAVVCSSRGRGLCPRSTNLIHKYTTMLSSATSRGALRGNPISVKSVTTPNLACPLRYIVLAPCLLRYEFKSGCTATVHIQVRRARSGDLRPLSFSPCTHRASMPFPGWSLLLTYYSMRRNDLRPFCASMDDAWPLWRQGFLSVHGDRPKSGSGPVGPSVAIKSSLLMQQTVLVVEQGGSAE